MTSSGVGRPVSGTAAAGYQRDGQPTQKGVCGSPKRAVINEFRQRANAIAGSSGRKKSTREIGVRQRVCGAYERPRVRLAGRNVKKTRVRDKEASPRASRKIICRLQEGQSKIQKLEKLVGKGEPRLVLCNGNCEEGSQQRLRRRPLRWSWPPVLYGQFSTRASPEPELATADGVRVLVQRFRLRSDTWRLAGD